MKKAITIFGGTVTLAAALVMGTFVLGLSDEAKSFGNPQVYAANVQPASDVGLTLSTGDNMTLTETLMSDSDGDIQLVEAKVEFFAYPEITVEINRPVRINFKVDGANLNACNNEILIPEWDIIKPLSVGDNYVEFTPTKTGTFKYMCWMDMIQSTVMVIDTNELQVASDAETQSSVQAEMATPMQVETLAVDYTLTSSDTVAANNSNDITTIEAKINLAAYPKIVVEAGKPVCINFIAEVGDLSSCNNEIIIPEWNIRKPLSIGDNYVEFTPTKIGTFAYSCWMNMIRSSITVIEQGAGEAEVLPLPESATTAVGCCGMMSGGSFNNRMGGYNGR